MQRHSVVLAVAATLVVHLLSLTRRLGPDEGGFAMVARHWTEAGRYLYGPQWVDRPPGLIAVFAAADRLGPYGVRLTATLFAVVLVCAVARAAEVVGGRPAAKWAAWTGFAFASSVLLEAQRLDGELVAAAFVTLSIGALLRALRMSSTRTRSIVRGAFSGAAATAAVLVKQNFVDAFAFTAILVGLGLATPGNRLTYRPSRALVTVLAFGVGAALPAAAAFAWAQRHGGPGALAYAMAGFRADALTTMARWSWAAPLRRLDNLLAISLGSGLLVLAVHIGYRARRRLLRADPLPWAVAGTAVLEVFGILAGVNAWPHYLVALVPTVAIAAGLGVNNRAPGARPTRILVILATAVTAVVSPSAAVAAAHASSAAYTTGRWVEAAASPHDSIVVPFSHANVIDTSGLHPGYPYAWSLPVRTLDPHLGLLVRTLNGGHAPTWVVRWDQPNTWGLDPRDRVEAALERHYRVVADVCGHPVWLHDGGSRHLPALPNATACRAGGP